MRCQKSKRLCPGYRDTFDLNLRDETKSTKRKASRVQQQHSLTHYSSASLTGSHRSRHSPNSSIYSIFDLAESRVYERNQHTSFVHQLSIPIDQQATCFFLSNYVLVPEEGILSGYLDFLVRLLKRPRLDPSFIAAFAAVAFAALGTRPNSKALAPKADYFYVKALKEINVALQDSTRSMDDATLAAIILLSIFEVSNCFTVFETIESDLLNSNLQPHISSRLAGNLMSTALQPS